MQRILTAMAAVTACLALSPGRTAADPVHSASIRLELEILRRKETHRMTVRLTDEGVRTEYELEGAGGKNAAAGAFGTDVREGLLRAWGAPSFGLKDWPSEICVTRDVRWVIESGRERRVICESQEHLHRLNGFREALRLLLRKD